MNPNAQQNYISSCETYSRNFLKEQILSYQKIIPLQVLFANLFNKLKFKPLFKPLFKPFISPLSPIYNNSSPLYL